MRGWQGSWAGRLGDGHGEDWGDRRPTACYGNGTGNIITRCNYSSCGETGLVNDCTLRRRACDSVCWCINVKSLDALHRHNPRLFRFGMPLNVAKAGMEGDLRIPTPDPPASQNFGVHPSAFKSGLPRVDSSCKRQTA